MHNYTAVVRGGGILNFLFQKKCLNVSRSFQICTGIIFLELSSEGLFIQLKKIFCCWITLIYTTKQQWGTDKTFILLLWTMVWGTVTQLSINKVGLTKPLTTSLNSTSKHSSHLRKPSKGIGRGEVGITCYQPNIDAW